MFYNYISTFKVNNMPLREEKIFLEKVSESQEFPEDFMAFYFFYEGLFWFFWRPKIYIIRLRNAVYGGAARNFPSLPIPISAMTVVLQYYSCVIGGIEITFLSIQYGSPKR